MIQFEATYKTDRIKRQIIFTQVGAVDRAKGEDDVDDEHVQWSLTSTLQGLGDSNNLVDIKPGQCRFGLLRRGGVYSMTVTLRNLDVEGTRFVIKPVQSEYIVAHYAPQQVAPGLSLTVTIEVRAHHAATLENVLDVKCKAHAIRIPILAKILDPADYDRLDAESVLLHGKRILSRAIEPKNEWEARKTLGPNYIGPNEVFTFAETQEQDTQVALPSSLGVQPDIVRGTGEELDGETMGIAAH